MAKKPKIPEHENMERWMVSYADLLTLLFALFVILYGFAMSAQNEVKSVIQGLVQSFSEMGFVTARPGSSVLVGNMGVDGTDSQANLSSVPSKEVPIVNAPVEGGGGVLDFGASATVNTPSPSSEKDSGINQKNSQANGLDTESRSDSEIMSMELTESITGAPLDSIQQEISLGLEDLIEEKAIVITKHENWLTIDFNSALLFPQGSATILNRFKPILDKVGSILSGINNYIHIRGYTDDRYVGDELYHSNWELSAARAISVLQYFERSGIDPHRMAIEAYGSYSPFASNSTKRGREQNRKVVIAISKYAYKPRNLPVWDDEVVNDKTDTAGKSAKPQISPEDYEIMRLPDGRMQLKKREH